MHICFLSSEYPLWQAGGVGSFLQTYGKALVKAGHIVSIVGIGSGHRELQLNDQGIKIYRLPKSKIPIGKFIFNTKNIANKIDEIDKENKIDIVESSELGLAFLAKKSNIKYVIRLHGGHHFFSESENRKIHWWQGLKEKLSFKTSDGFIAVSQFVKEHTAKYLLYHDKPVEIIYSPINTELFSPIKTMKQNFNITFVGSICEKKGIRQLILSLEIIAKKYPNIKLNIYGREWLYKDGRSYTKMLYDNYKTIIDKYVNFHGVVRFEELPKKYALAHVCVFPSHMETQGLVAQEAMSMGKPVVFSKLGPGNEIIEDYQTGLLCNPLDINDISDKVIWFLDNGEKLDSIGKNARKFILEVFNLDKAIRKNISFYERIIKALK